MLKYKLITNATQTNRMVEEITAAYPTLLGFDTESTINTDGSISNVGLLQFALYHGLTPDNTKDLGTALEGNFGKIAGVTTIYLVSLASFGRLLPKSLERLLTNQSIKKVGCGIRQDAMLVSKKYGTKVRGTIDLQEVAESIGIVGVSLDKLSKLYLATGKIEFDLFTANWDTPLTEAQIRYAAVDAALSLHSYLALFQPVPVPKLELPIDEWEKEAFDLLDFLKSTSVFKGTRRPTIETLERTTRNGYSRWVSIYRPQQLIELFRSYFKLLVDTKKLFVDQATFEVSLDPPVVRQVVKLDTKPNQERTTKILRQIAINPEGLPRKSLIKFLVTGFTNEHKPEEKEAYAIAILETLLEDKLVEAVGERIRTVSPVGAEAVLVK